MDNCTLNFEFHILKKKICSKVRGRFESFSENQLNFSIT